MFEFCVGLILGIFIGQNFIVPDIKECVKDLLNNLEH